MKILVVYKLIVLGLLSFPALVAGTVNDVPMQGGMVMPMVSYHAAESRLRVMPDETVPELTPLLVSHPGDDFDPADPWYATLSPRRQGYSFSRRYGFVMDSMTDPLPAGTEMWIRKLEGTSGLKAYRSSSSEPKAFEAIFGTDGSTNAMHWNGMMFHPTFAAPPGTTAHSAVFEVYLVEAGSGMEVANSSTGPFTLNWTNVPDGRPALMIEPGLVIRWPSAATNYLLESAAGFAGQWTAVTNAPVLDGEMATVELAPDQPQQFFRMRVAE